MKQIQNQDIIERRRKILEAAERIFKRKGIEDASIRKIALEAGVTTGAIYPYFDGKEEIYAELLSESLERLYIQVADAAAMVADGARALKSSSAAFYDYYQKRIFEFELGFHLFAGVKRSSLGKGRDKILNSKLIRVLDVLAVCIKRAAPNLTDIEVSSERNSLFATLSGILTLVHTGRTKAIGSTGQELLEHHMNSLIIRLRH